MPPLPLPSNGSLLFKAGARASVVIAVAMAAFAGQAAAAGCHARQSAGYRVLPLDGERRIAVWYPTDEAEADHAYGSSRGVTGGRVAVDAQPAACPPAPLVVFSHGFGGCGLQSLFITEELARHGYVVAAPDHRDAASCAIEAGSAGTPRPVLPPFLTPQRWTDASSVDRRDDLRQTIRIVGRDPRLGGAVDLTRLGAIGHSLGGYSVLGMAGAWPSWKEPNLKAVLALSPYVAPFVAQGGLDHLGVAVMYQGAVFDWGITPSLEGADGAYAKTSPPKYFLKLDGGTHFEWTNLVCFGQNDSESCLRQRPNAWRIDRYGIEFLDRHLKGKPSLLLRSRGIGVAGYWFDER